MRSMALQTKVPDAASEPATSATTSIEPSAANPKGSDAVLDTEYKEADLPMVTIMRDIMDQYNRTQFELLTEIAKLSFSEGKIGPDEYIEQRLFDRANLKGDLKDFVGVLGSKAISATINHDRRFDAVITDKITFYTLFNGLGVPTIQTRAYYSTELSLPGLNTLTTKEALLAFLLEPGNYPFFGKPSYSSLSLGAIGARSIDTASRTIELINGTKIPAETLANEIVEEYADGFLFQELLEPAPEWAEIVGNRIGTVRLYTLNKDQNPKLHRAVLKLTVKANMADNFWRSGNLLAQVDMTAGEILRVIQGSGMNQIEIENHPDTGKALLGARIPNWEKTVELAFLGAKVARDLPLIGWDIAPTNRGPVIVEANRGPDLRLPQMAERRGALDGDLRALVSECKAEAKAQKSTNISGRSSFVKQRVSRYKFS